jgi:hypothetical protein
MNDVTVDWGVPVGSHKDYEHVKSGLMSGVAGSIRGLFKKLQGASNTAPKMPEAYNAVQAPSRVPSILTGYRNVHIYLDCSHG